MGALPECVFVHHVPACGALGGQVLGPLELEL